MTSKLNFGRDVQGYNAYAPNPSTKKYSVNLINGVPENLTIPGDYENWIMTFSPQVGTDIWVSFNGGNAVLPSTGVFSSTNSEQNPSARAVKEGDVISVISGNTTCMLGVCLWGV